MVSSVTEFKNGGISDVTLNFLQNSSTNSPSPKSIKPYCIIYVDGVTNNNKRTYSSSSTNSLSVSSDYFKTAEKSVTFEVRTNSYTGSIFDIVTVPVLYDGPPGDPGESVSTV
jgi:hypothetical protein